MSLWLRSLAVLAITCSTLFAELEVTVTRFGTCLNISDCQMTFTGDGTVNFDVPTIGELPDGIFSASGL